MRGLRLTSEVWQSNSSLFVADNIIIFLNQLFFSVGYIKLSKPLDYETKRDYTFNVAATDGGGRETTAAVKIFVEDVNDNDPNFEKNQYSGSVAENVKVGHVVGVVKATDADSGPRGRVLYAITAGNIGNAFRINAAGRLTIVVVFCRYFYFSSIHAHEAMFRFGSFLKFDSFNVC